MSTHRHNLVIGTLALLVAACTTPEPPAPPQLVWPAEPEAPRIAYMGAFTTPEDLGIRKGLWQRIGEILFGAEPARIVRPTAVLDVDGVVYVADPGAKGVHRFDRKRGRYDLLRAADDTPLVSPVALARGRGGTVFVTDSARAAVFVLLPEAKSAMALSLQHKLLQPTGIAFDQETGRLTVVDTAAHRLFVFAPDGALAAPIGERGTGDGQFNYPTLLWRDPGGRLFVTDSLNFRVQILDAGGTFIGKFGRHGDGSGDLARHKGVATDRFGHVYVVDALFHALQVFDESGRLLLTIGGRGEAAGEFWLPTGVFVGDGDTIYVADSYNRRVQMFRYVGGPA